ncbi:uncharacterized protein TRAVEDRAFT_49362 [Trametes versicolor FP-101664 SS1]|uniref:uncharacterized protein n=1 Tax=Trametes versicolor (strain FP-101664) TaxID=717944 RepID=UPI0004623DA3|nr:uncharacterized protein TRAVEDRAFT_49362 [Trametes versicolor FP-101664 SS1]EIW56537.1 hypothetical protein TRAVEDRAFT_49362 [Trametes versicolor FP-101664 SS1]
MSSSLQIWRGLTLGFSAAAGIAVLSLGVRLKSISLSKADQFLVLAFFQHPLSPVFEVFGIAVGAITASTLILQPILRLLVGFLRTGAFTSMVVVELVWTSILGVLWLAEGILSAHITLRTPFGDASCESDFLSPNIQQVCNETQVLVGISFAAWIARECPAPLIFGATLCISVFVPLTPPPPTLAVHTYAITLLVFALNRSHSAPVWTSSVVGRHASVVPVGYSASQDAIPLVTTQPQPNPYPAQGEQQVLQVCNAAPTPAPNSRGDPDAPLPQAPGPYGPSYADSSASLGYHGHSQL